ncbi:hypothetical protein BN2537_10377 [Streptomyces venezuelae]|nr:hypothetical protein BN2537_10377 [Streptomyces venezuelae]
MTLTGRQDHDSASHGEVDLPHPFCAFWQMYGSRLIMSTSRKESS